ncbi:HNH endonuclease [Mycolicibacterium elephantis]|uniref:HNH endonuclease n=1 Tax=Mycolicibacterium elephantis TaxID=81858 RepID=UPI000FE1D111|nr:HNH endonuclease [Mycolicibacterium elephantis]
MIARPCLGCGHLIAAGSRCGDCQPKRQAPTLSAAKRGYDYRWQKLSQQARQKQPWCALCGSTNQLQADHIVPVSEAPEIRLEPLNVRVLCADCNKRRGNKCTDAERQHVHAAIQARKQRRAAYYRTQLDNGAQRGNETAKETQCS